MLRCRFTGGEFSALLFLKKFLYFNFERYLHWIKILGCCFSLARSRCLLSSGLQNCWKEVYNIFSSDNFSIFSLSLVLSNLIMIIMCPNVAFSMFILLGFWVSCICDFYIFHHIQKIWNNFLNFISLLSLLFWDSNICMLDYLILL